MSVARPLGFVAAWAALLVVVPLASAQKRITVTRAAPLLHLIPADAVGGMTVDASRVRTDRLFRRSFAPLLAAGEPMAEPLDELGLRIDQVEGVAIFLPPAPAPDPEDRYPRREPFGEPIFLFRATEPFEGPARLIERGIAQMLPDGRTLAISDGRGNAGALEALGAANAPAAGSAAALAEKLGEQAPAALLAFGDVTIVRGMMLRELDFAARQEDEWIPAFGLLRPAIAEADAYAVAVDLQDGALSARLVAASPGAEAAGRLKRTAEAAVTLAENVLNGLPAAMMRRDPGEAAIVTLVANALRKVAASIEVGADVVGAGPDGNGGAARVTVSVTADAEVTAAGANLMVAVFNEEFRRGRDYPRPVREVEVQDAEEAADAEDMIRERAIRGGIDER
ncbi:hypothetical protein [Alienimonas chondri]|uniref:DUF2066 domain-containing protein n=1 Tax=Alienimonas chondri TaxID=2681879 RepID=A0ABX1VG77_9PLAN|nr:hypothetical protein [Alienimonas chondri]NNJ27129.1 hypothetical protein [Alienimonas chondri]